MANGLHIHVPKQDTATIKLTDLPSPPGQRMVSADVQINPPNLVGDHPDWVTILAWQGKMQNDRGLVINRLQKVGPGHYVSTEPIPVWGEWKTLLRVHDGRTLAAVPIWAPADAAIPVPEIPVLANGTRPSCFEVSILQRERDPGVPAWLFTAGGIVVLFFTLSVITALTWGAGRIKQLGDRAQRSPGRGSRALTAAGGMSAFTGIRTVACRRGSFGAVDRHWSAAAVHRNRPPGAGLSSTSPSPTDRSRRANATLQAKVSPANHAARHQ